MPSELRTRIASAGLRGGVDRSAAARHRRADAAANPLLSGRPTSARSISIYVNNDTLAAGPDGLIDPSGMHFVNLPAPLLSRDNLRQGAVDLLALTRSLADLDLDGDRGRRYRHHAAFTSSAIRSAASSAACISARRTPQKCRRACWRWPAAASRTPSWIRLLSARASCRAWRAQGITQGSTLYAQFVRDVQTIVDAGDPVNYIAAAAAARPLLLFQVVGGGELAVADLAADQVVVNSATQRLIDAAASADASPRRARTRPRSAT